MKTTTELATDFDTTPRTLRKFLRSPESGIESVGKGSRYSLPSSKREVAALRKRFAKWTEAQETARKARNDAPDAPEAVEADDAPSLDEMTHPDDA